MGEMIAAGYLRRPQRWKLEVPTGNGGDKKDVNHCGTSGMSLVLCSRD